MYTNLYAVITTSIRMVVCICTCVFVEDFLEVMLNWWSLAMWKFIAWNVKQTWMKLQLQDLSEIQIWDIMCLRDKEEKEPRHGASDRNSRWLVIKKKKIVGENESRCHLVWIDSFLRHWEDAGLSFYLWLCFWWCFSYWNAEVVLPGVTCSGTVELFFFILYYEDTYNCIGI